MHIKGDEVEKKKWNKQCVRRCGPADTGVGKNLIILGQSHSSKRSQRGSGFAPKNLLHLFVQISPPQSKHAKITGTCLQSVASRVGPKAWRHTGCQYCNLQEIIPNKSEIISAAA